MRESLDEDPAQRRKLLGLCYQNALLALRKRHDDEFRSLLQQQYDERGLRVSLRRSRITTATSK